MNILQTNPMNIHLDPSKEYISLHKFKLLTIGTADVYNLSGKYLDIIKVYKKEFELLKQLFKKVDKLDELIYDGIMREK